MISKNASTPSQNGLNAESAVRIGVLSEPDELAIKKLP